MVEVKIGDSVKVIPNTVYSMANTTAIDTEHWYGEIFGTFPVYKYIVDINRVDEDEDFDIYNTMFEDIVASGDFTPMVYEYNREKKKSFIPKMRSKQNLQQKTHEIYVSKFVLISNTEPVMICYEYDDVYVMSHLGKEKVDEIVDKYLRKYNQEDVNAKSYVVVKDPDLYLEDFTIKLDGDLDFDLYNDGFEDIHNSIVKSINEDKNGLYLFYGKPGTGKTTYIRHLINQCSTEKHKFITVPGQLFEDFTNPSVLPFLMRNRGCVFIIEDCEDLVTVDDGVRSNGISDLLNMTDGLLADALSIKIICTFNTDYNKIDEALLRPGRCRCKYEFELLKKERASAAAKKLGLKAPDGDISLAELFNPEIKNKDEKKKKIGFSN